MGGLSVEEEGDDEEDADECEVAESALKVCRATAESNAQKSCEAAVSSGEITLGKGRKERKERKGRKERGGESVTVLSKAEMKSVRKQLQEAGMSRAEKKALKKTLKSAKKAARAMKKCIRKAVKEACVGEAAQAEDACGK